ncbi:MAG TPA: prolipoprotein diacylglyceryl transferase family protein [Candidatus Limnocylindrales bacterium]|nr:prolipoprotein diacylglyceryl transferase family protein [Candidatus Limnocylindrales bacterium]
MPTAVIAFDFDPFLRIGDGAVRWETIAVAAAILAAIVLAGIGARSMDLRGDDVLFVVLGAVPGAVVGGRLGYVLLHPDFFAARPAAIVDPGVGSLALTLGVVGGALTGGLVAALVEGRVGRWFHIATLPLLAGLAAGKLAMVFGGRGQGQPFDGDLATAFLGPGPWGSLSPATPSHPSQVYEGLGSLLVLVAMLGVLAVPAARRPDGRSFLIALALWAAVRAIVASTWRDPVVAGPFRTEQVLDLAIVVMCVAGVVLLIARERPAPEPATTG